MSTKKVIILGSGPAGYTAAIYAARAGLEPLLVEGIQPGGQLTITTDVENYPGFPKGIQGPQLMAEMKAQAERFGTTFVTGIADKADLSEKPIKINVGSDEYLAETLIISTGASARWLGLEAEKRFNGRGVSACATCDGFFYKDKVVMVVGGGETALEEAIFLTRFAKEVHVVHRRDELRAGKYMQELAFKNDKLNFVWDSVVDDILGDDQKGVTGIRLKNVKSGDLSERECDGVFLAIGHKPNSEIFTGQLDMDENGYIKTVPGKTATKIAGVFAAGDVQDHYYRQAATAVGTGCMAAIEAERYLASL